MTVAINDLKEKILYNLTGILLALVFACGAVAGNPRAQFPQAIERGFSDVARIEQNEDFAILRDEKDYQKLIAGLKKS